MLARPSDKNNFRKNKERKRENKNVIACLSAPLS